MKDTGNKQVNAALKTVLKDLLQVIKKNGQLQQHHRKVSESKIYDRLQKKYLEKEKLKKDLGQNYESSGTDSEEQNQYKGLNQNQIRYLIRKKLIKKKFSPKYLEEVLLCPPADPELNYSEQHDSSLQINEAAQAQPNTEKLQIINEANQIFLEDVKEDKNLFALKFIIEGLEKLKAKC